jgi:hypothetical protein
LRHGFATRIAVGAPKIQDDDFSFETGRENFLAIQGDEAEIW